MGKLTDIQVFEKLLFLAQNEANDFLGTGSDGKSADKEADEWYNVMEELLNEFENRTTPGGSTI